MSGQIALFGHQGTDYRRYLLFTKQDEYKTREEPVWGGRNKLCRSGTN